MFLRLFKSEECAGDHVRPLLLSFLFGRVLGGYSTLDDYIAMESSTASTFHSFRKSRDILVSYTQKSHRQECSGRRENRVYGTIWEEGNLQHTVQ